MKTAIVLGAGGKALGELAEARALAPGAILVAVNVAITKCRGADAFCTLHPEKAHTWEPQAYPMPGETYSSDTSKDWRPKHLVPERWGGTSGLYAVQMALERMDCDRVILAGVPMNADAQSLYGPGAWGQGHVKTYRDGWLRAFPRIVDRVRSVSGWTRELLGYPSSEWLGTVRHLADSLAH